MASSWGTSWGESWGESWGGVGVIIPPIPPASTQTFASGSGGEKKLFRPRVRNALAQCRELVVKCTGDPCRASVSAQASVKENVMASAMGNSRGYVSALAKCGELSVSFHSVPASASAFILFEKRGDVMSDAETIELVNSL